MRVQKYQGRWTFNVESQSSPYFGLPGDDWLKDAHIVDLEENFVNTEAHGVIPNGGCNCDKFVYKMLPTVSGGRQIRQCHHIKAALYFIVSELIMETINLDRKRKTQESIGSVLYKK